MSLAVLALAGCATEAYDAADLQVDVAAPLPAAAETLRLCVRGAGLLETGAGNGRAAFTGLPAGEPTELSLTVLDEAGGVLGGAGPVTVDTGSPYTSTPWRAGAEDPCDAEGDRVAAGEPDWLLAVRFAEDR